MNKDGVIYMRQTVPGSTTYYPWESFNTGTEIHQPLPRLSSEGQTSGGAGQEPDTYRGAYTSPTNEDGLTFTTEFYADSAATPTCAKVTFTQKAASSWARASGIASGMRRSCSGLVSFTLLTISPSLARLCPKWKRLAYCPISTHDSTRASCARVSITSCASFPSRRSFPKP